MYLSECVRVGGGRVWAIINILSSDADLEEKKEQLIARANALGGKDNITVALAEYRDEHTYPNQQQGKEDEEKRVITGDPLKQEIACEEDEKNSHTRGRTRRGKKILSYIITIVIIATVVVTTYLYLRKQ